MAEATTPGQQGVLFIPNVERLTLTVVAESAFSRPWVRTVIDACEEQP